MSFMTGRRPSTLRSWNFYNHFRQARCEIRNLVLFSGGVEMPGGWHSPDIESVGGSAQCCTTCTGTPGCVGWNFVDKRCTLFSAVDDMQTRPCDSGKLPCKSGRSGFLPKWTTMPQLLREQGYTVYGVGKARE